MEPAVKLLVVDDDEVDRMIIQRSLRTAKMNAHIQNATLGAEALEALEQHAFDFIFIDFMLPDMNGLELLQKIREKGITTPVQIVTSQGDERVAVEAMKIGASDYLPKTLLTPEGISQSIRSAIQLHRFEQERQQAQEQLARTQKQLDTVINGAPIILWAVDKDGIFTMTRGKGLSLIGREEGQSVGSSIFEVYQEFPTILACVKRSLQGQHSACTINIRDTWFYSLFLPQLNAAGQAQGAIGVSYDITDRVEKEQELKKAKDEALNMAQVKEQFLANMSHEIRTPMNGILGLANVLANTPLDDQQREYLQGIQTSANNLMVIINDLLDFSKIEAGKVSFEVIPFELKTLIRQLVTILEIRAQERGNSLKLLFDDAIPTFLEGDPFRLSQILNNLLGNAIKFTQNGLVKLHVEAIAQQGDLFQLEFTVKDTGIGIPPEKLGSIFEKFTQGSSDTTRKFGGTGLGLSIAKELVEMQGGEVTVESEPQKGSTFQFRLPFRKITADDPANQPAPAATVPIECPLRHRRVLLAEDNAINQLLVKKILTDHEVQVEVAENGLKVLELLAQRPAFDLILMDMQMPEMDGYETMQHIRQQLPAHSHLPIIALTAHAAPGELRKCLAAGADSYVSKPFKAEELLHEISALLQTMPSVKNILPTLAAPAPASCNLDYLREFAGGNEEFMLDILTLYLKQVPGLALDLEKAATAQNWLDTKNLAHKLKPSLALVGCHELEKLAETVEVNAQHQNNLDQVPGQVQQLRSLIEISLTHLKEEVQHLQEKLSSH